jgi:hypothetical protein
METESEDEHIENTEVISPSVTPVQVSTLLVDVPPVRVSINSRQIKRNTITTNRVEKKNVKTDKRICFSALKIHF